MVYIDGILPKGPYPPCLRMADRALLAAYPRYVRIMCLRPVSLMIFPSKFKFIDCFLSRSNQVIAPGECTSRPLKNAVAICWPGWIKANQICNGFKFCLTNHQWHGQSLSPLLTPSIVVSVTNLNTFIICNISLKTTPYVSTRNFHSMILKCFGPMLFMLYL